MDTACGFTGSIETRDNLTVGVKNLSLGIDFQTAHGVVNSRNLLAGVPRTFCHLLVSLVVGDEAQRILVCTGDNTVVVFNSLLQVGSRHVEFLGQFVKCRSRNNTTEVDHVFHLGAVGVNPVKRRIAEVVNQYVVSRTGLCKDSLSQNVTRSTFVDEAVAFLVNEQTVAAGCTNHFHQTGTRCSAGMNLNVGHADNVCTDFFTHDDAGTLSGLVEVRAADTLAEVIVFEHAGVDFLTKSNVSTEAAGCQDDALVSHELGGLAGVVVFSYNSDNTAGLVLNQGDSVHVGVDLHVVAMSGDVFFKRTNVGVAGRSSRIVRTLPQSTGSGTDFIFELNADAFKPVNRL